MATLVADKEVINTSETLTAPTLTGGVVAGKSAADTIGFWGATVTSQPTSSKEAALTDSSGGTYNASTGISANAQRYTVPIYLGALADITQTTNQFKVSIPHAFQIVSASFRAVTRVPTTASKAVTLQLAIAGTSTGGGSLAVTTAGVTQVGTGYPFSAVTGASTGTAGQTLEVFFSSLTTFAEGNGMVEVAIINTDKANESATLAQLQNQIRSDLVTVGIIKGS